MSTVETRTRALAQRLWDFHTRPAAPGAPGNDLVLVLGSHDLRVATHAAHLWRTGAAPLLLITGDRGRRTRHWPQSEARTFADAARRAAPIPDHALLLETRAHNTGDNFRYSRDLLARTGRSATRALATAKPYMAQRALATAALAWPECTWTFSSFSGGYQGCTSPEHTGDELIHFLVGDTQRLHIYARRGWSAPVAIPPDVWHAYDELITRGYTHHLIPGEPARPAD